MRERLWYKLDNSAKIMPSMTNNLNTNVFRLTCALSSEVDAHILQEALDEALIEYPMFLFTMKTGLFWHYLEKTNIKPLVEEDRYHPCSKLNSPLLFRLTYYKKRINLDIYHVLTDGNGAIGFLKFILATYLNKKYSIDSKATINSSSEYEKTSDDFAKFDRSKFKIKLSESKRAYNFKFPRKNDAVHDVIEAHMSASEVKKCAKKYDATVTVYLCAVLIDSIIKCARLKDLKRPIGITIPADLRNVFPSHTSRNFFYTILIQYKYFDGYTFWDIIEFLKSEFAKSLSKENLQERMNTYMLLEKFLIVRIIPTFLKEFVMRIILGFTSKNETMTLSNLGVIDLPLEYSSYIESISCVMSSNAIHLTTATYKDTLVLGFTSHFVSKEVERTMIKTLQSEGVGKVMIVSNERSESDDKV